MSLIELMDREDWKNNLRRNFEYAIYIMKNDRFRHVSSGVDDLRGWLSFGGVSRVRKQLNRQMKSLRYSEAKIAEVNGFLEQLTKENRSGLLDLMVGGVLLETKQEWLSACGLSGMDFEDLFRRILEGEKPFEDWMVAQGHSDKEIQDIYSLIDSYLLKHGIVDSPDPSGVH